MNADARNFPRKLLRCPALLALPGVAAMRGRLLDISLGGVSMIVGEQMHPGQSCTVRFETVLNGKPVRVTATARVIYSILSGTEGFRMGLQFVDLDPATHKSVAELTM